MAILNGIKLTGSDEVHQLDYEKAIANKPFYSEQGEIVEILPQTDFEFSPIPDAPLSLYMSMPTLEENPTFTFGQTYTIMWDNIEYQRICKDVEGVLCLGDVALGGMGEDTGEPFLIAYDVSNEQFMIVTSEQGEMHNIGVYQNNEVVHQLDSKYVDAYTKSEINEMLGVYIEEVNTLLGGDE